MNAEMTVALQCELNLLHNQEMIAIQQMLLLALRNGFSVGELTKFAGHYQTNAAVVENRNGNYYVNYATGDGYFSRSFGYDYQCAQNFADTFDTWWY
ncbi:hypothetical protein BH012_20025 [Salmonella enterica]|nr:hypothetical protein [Salmonella enterica]EAX6603583.1 hypothetical protein [Salmonella enterica]